MQGWGKLIRLLGELLTSLVDWLVLEDEGRGYTVATSKPKTGEQPNQYRRPVNENREQAD